MRFAGNIQIPGGYSPLRVPGSYQGYGAAPEEGFTPVYSFWGPVPLPEEIGTFLDDLPIVVTTVSAPAVMRPESVPVDWVLHQVSLPEQAAWDDAIAAIDGFERGLDSADPEYAAHYGAGYEVFEPGMKPTPKKRSWVLPTMLGIGGLAAIIGIGYMATK